MEKRRLSSQPIIGIAFIMSWFVLRLLVIKFDLALDRQVDLSEVSADAFVIQSSGVKRVFEILDMSFITFKRSKNFKTIIVDCERRFHISDCTVDQLFYFFYRNRTTLRNCLFFSHVRVNFWFIGFAFCHKDRQTIIRSASGG